MISVKKLKTLLRYNPKTGKLYWIKKRNGIRGVGKLAGCVHGKDNKRYVIIKIDDVQYGAHVLGWMLFHGRRPPRRIDHKNRDGLNNRIKNLRLCSFSQNCMNRRRRTDNTSGYKGVHRLHYGRYMARIGFGGKRICLGIFADPKVAGRAYDLAAAKVHGRFALTNGVAA